MLQRPSGEARKQLCDVALGVAEGQNTPVAAHIAHVAHTPALLFDGHSVPLQIINLENGYRANLLSHAFAGRRDGEGVIAGLELDPAVAIRELQAQAECLLPELGELLNVLSHDIHTLEPRNRHLLSSVLIMRTLV